MSDPIMPPGFPPPPPPPPIITSSPQPSAALPEGPLVATALAAHLKTGDYTGFSAELDRSGENGVRRRIEISGDGRVRVSWSGALDGAPARSIGIRTGTVATAALEALAEACRIAAPDVLGMTDDAPLILRVQAAAAHVSGVPAADAGRLLEAAFESLTEAARPLTELVVALKVRREGERWRGTVRLCNLGVEPLVCLHPGHAARLGVLTLRNGGDQVDGFVVESDRDRILLEPGAWTEAAFEAPPASGAATLVLRWGVRYPLLDAMLGAYAAPEGLLESAPVQL